MCSTLYVCQIMQLVFMLVLLDIGQITSKRTEKIKYYDKFSLPYFITFIFMQNVCYSIFFCSSSAFVFLLLFGYEKTALMNEFQYAMSLFSFRESKKVSSYLQCSMLILFCLLYNHKKWKILIFRLKKWLCNEKE